MKIFVVPFFFLFLNECHGQQPQHDFNFPTFKTYAIDILQDSANFWVEYPTPPSVTDDVLLGMENEIYADDSAKFYLEKLSSEKFKSAIDYENAFCYFNKMDYSYSLLALTAHWNPDLRVMALRHLNEKFAIRPLVNSHKMKNGEWKKYDLTAIEFLLYLLQSNPLFISGSENSTIHGIYISNIVWNLDLLTHENIVAKLPLHSWYKNDLQFEQAVMQWKGHLK